MPKLSLNASKKTKHTPAGEIPVDWGWGPAKHLVQSLQSGTSLSGEDREPEGDEIALLKVSAVTSGKFLPTEAKAVSQDQSSRLRLPVRKGQILVNRANGSARLVGTAVYVDQDCPNTYLPDKLWSVTHDPSTASDRFLAFVLSWEDFVKQVHERSSGGTGMRNISSKAYLQIPVPFPPLPEQRRIADILTTWDRTIETLQSLIAAKERRKQALMQQLLTHTDDFAKAGHSRHRLGEVIERVTRKNPNGDLNVLTISAQQGLVSQSSYFNRNVAGEDLSKYYQLKRGEFAYNRSSSKGFPFGAIKRLNAHPTGVVSTLYLCFRITDETITCSDFLCHYFDSGMLNQGLRCVAQEGARAHGLLNVTSTDFMDLDVCLPDYATQKHIATILDTADRELTLHRQHLATLRTQKRGLMKLLLTGEIRTR